MKLNGAAIAMLVEDYIRFRVATTDGTRYVALSDPFLEGLNALHQGSKIPTITGVQTLPLVVARRDGTIFLKKNMGLDRSSGVVFRIDPRILEAIQDPTEITFADAKAAYGRLVNDLAS